MAQDWRKPGRHNEPCPPPDADSDWLCEGSIAQDGCFDSLRETLSLLHDGGRQWQRPLLDFPGRGQNLCAYDEGR